jgi:ligand-binding SRPBCC domain-containing protein
MSKVYQLKRVQFVPGRIEDIWQFFSSPANLEHISPKNMNFKITSTFHGESMYAGQIIEYTLTPLLGIPVYWMTEITHVIKHQFFIDEQRFGPYSFWHHQHHFKEVPGGIEMTDIVHYKIPYWFIGDIANALIVQKKLEAIFEYRKKVIEETFGK